MGCWERANFNTSQREWTAGSDIRNPAPISPLLGSPFAVRTSVDTITGRRIIGWRKAATATAPGNIKLGQRIFIALLSPTPQGFENFNRFLIAINNCTIGDLPASMFGEEDEQ